MSENPTPNNLINQQSPDSDKVDVIYSRPHPIKRLGCGLLLVLWFTLLLTPCAFFYLASNGEIRISYSDIPDSYNHPRLLIRLVSEVDSRGLMIMRSSPVTDKLSDNAMCVQTDVNYLLWESNEENQNVRYCDCYERDSSESIWVLSSTLADACGAESE